MKETVRLLQQDFESGTRETEQFKHFALTFRRELVKTLKDNFGIKEFTFSRGHFYCSGFFKTEDDKVYYFSQSDVRHFPKADLLIRTAKDFKDYTGGCNNYLPFSEDMFVNYKLPK